MSREIKFKSKRVDNGEWVIGTGITDFLNVYPEKKDKIWLWSHLWLEIIPETVGQCTGLIDKNGKLIFEGDIDRSGD